MPLMPVDDARVVSLGRASSRQAEFYASRKLYTAYGGARGGGKTHAVRIKALLGAVRWPGIRILIVRRTYPELLDNHIRPMQQLIPEELAVWRASEYTFYFHNGSTIRFGHYGSGSDREYQGREYDWIFLDEATQFTEEEFRTMGGCLRGVNDIPRRFYLTCNPGGVGHAWVKRLFIDRDFKRSSEIEEENENPDDYVFIPATVEDNEALLSSEGGRIYRQMLSALPENLRRAHRYGDWDALSGAYFSEIRREKHLCRAFDIPESWSRYRSLDYGLDTFACLWIAVEPATGRSYVYRMTAQPGLVASRAAELMLQLSEGERIEATFAPPDLWGSQSVSGMSPADAFFAAGVPLIKAPNTRAAGHLMVKEALQSLSDGEPGLRIMEGCMRLFNDLSTIQASETNPNDCALQPHDCTHTVDALRYYCASRKGAADKAEVPAEREFIYETKEESEEEYTEDMEEMEGYI